MNEGAEKASKVKLNSFGITNAIHNLAQLQTKQNRLDEAILNIQQSLIIRANSAYAIGIRGKAYMEKMKFKHALADFDKSIQTMPRLPNHYIDRGIIHLIKGNKTKAKAASINF